MLSVTFIYYYAECRYAVCRGAINRYKMSNCLQPNGVVTNCGAFKCLMEVYWKWWPKANVIKLFIHD
jgi:hypothetical protein